MRARVQRLSLISQAAQLLRQELQRGTWQGQLPGERLLADQLGVSRPTLRAALLLLRDEGLLTIRHGRPTEILTAPPAPAPRARQVNLLSPVPLREMPPLMVCWIDELRERLAAAGQFLELVVRRAAFAARGEHLLRQLTGQGPDAVWILYLSGARMQRWFTESRLPCLVAGSTYPGISLPSIDLDYRAICRHAAGLMLGRGRQRPALVLPDTSAPGDAESEEGFREAFAGKDIAPLILRHDGSREDLCERVRAACQAKKPADGFLVARSAHALTVLTLLQHEGLRVPADAAVISRDDDAFLRHAVPEVARYASDPREWARRVTKITLDLIAGATPGGSIRLMPQFERGGTW